MEQHIYPIGRMPDSSTITKEELSACIKRVSELPVKLMKLHSSIKKEEFAYSYREGGWNIARIIHHIADSHMNLYIRIKLALSENHPTIKPYNENKWAEMPDAISGADTHVSVLIISGIHHRLSVLLNTLTEDEMQKTVYHPERKKDIRIADMCSMYAWHGDHHLAQIEVALNQKL